MGNTTEHKNLHVGGVAFSINLVYHVFFQYTRGKVGFPGIFVGNPAKETGEPCSPVSFARGRPGSFQPFGILGAVFQVVDVSTQHQIDVLRQRPVIPLRLIAQFFQQVAVNRYANCLLQRFHVITQGDYTQKYDLFLTYAS